jgi:molybdopterin-guanine dinucleotide biosynthesis protein
MPGSHPAIIGIGGLASNTGKTTLLCELLGLFPGWEAIKTTRGHYRSCGKDPHTCCVSHLLQDEALVLSGRTDTYGLGKDTGRYWDAGASNVHWVIATAGQIGCGIKEALGRVQTAGVFVEGNSFSEFVDVDAMLMVASVDGQSMKASARRALSKSSMVFLTSGSGEVLQEAQEHFMKWLRLQTLTDGRSTLPAYSWSDLSRVAAEIRNTIHCVQPKFQLSESNPGVVT